MRRYHVNETLSRSNGDRLQHQLLPRLLSLVFCYPGCFLSFLILCLFSWLLLWHPPCSAAGKFPVLGSGCLFAWIPSDACSSFPGLTWQVLQFDPVQPHVAFLFKCLFQMKLLKIVIELVYAYCIFVYKAMYLLTSCQILDYLSLF